MTTVDTMPDIDDIMRYEQGDMNDEDTIEFFQKMINTGVCWRLQGHYGRVATALIEAGYCTRPTKE